MGREETELWYSEIDFSEIEVLIIEWTHGNSDYFDGVDFPVLLNSTPEETLAHRRARNRDGAVDSGFTTTVLEIEQELLKKQAHKAKVIVSKQNELLDWDSFKKLMNV
jgi:alpha-galactosidase